MTTIIVIAPGNSLANEDKIIEVTLTIEAPFTKEVFVIKKYSGTMLYTADSQKASIRNQYSLPKEESKNLSSTLLNKLESTIKNRNFWSFKEDYTDEFLADSTRYTVSIKAIPPGPPELVDAYYYTVSCAGDCPKNIMEIVNSIKHLWGKKLLEIGI